MSNEKCVMVIDGSLPASVAANTAAILGITLGKQVPQAVGCDVADQDGHAHLGIVEVPVPILRATAEEIGILRGKLCDPIFGDVMAVDFSDLAQGCRTYDEFIERMASARGDDLRYLGIALYGAKKKVNKLTGSMPLFR